MLGILGGNYITRGFWGDEAWTALISQQGLGEIIRITGEDFHPPLYYFIIHYWMQLFGSGELAVRVVSMIFFLLTILVVFLFAKTIKGKVFALFVTLLIFVNPLLTTYAFEARSYGLVGFFSMLTTYLFWQSITKNSTKYQLAYIFTGILSLYTHYYMGFLLLAQAISVLFLAPKRIIRWIGIFVVIGIGYIPWLPTLISQIKTVNQGYWIAPINERTHYEFYLRLLTGEFDTPQRFGTMIFASFLLIVSLLINLRSSKPEWRKYLFLVTLLAIPILVPTFISFIMSPIFFYRYLIFLVIPLSFITSWGFYSKTYGYILLAILIILQLSITWAGLARNPYSMREEMKDIEKKVNQNDVLVTTLPSFAEVAYYNRKGLKLYVLSKGLVQSSGKSLLDAFVRSGRAKIIDRPPAQNYWLVKPGPESKYVKKNLE